MTITAMPFATSPLSTEDQWRSLVRGLVAPGVVRGALNELQVYGDGSGRQVKVRTGHALVDGILLMSDAEITVPLTTNSSGNPRIDRIVARITPATDTAVIDKLTGTPAATPAAPALTQDITGIYEIPLALVAVANGYTTVAAGDVTDDRVFAVATGRGVKVDGALQTSRRYVDIRAAMGMFAAASDDAAGDAARVDLGLSIDEDFISASETTTSGSYTDLPTVGPQVVGTTGPAGGALVFLTAEFTNTDPTNGDTGWMTVVFDSGGGPSAATDIYALKHDGKATAQTKSRLAAFFALAPDTTYTVTCKYKTAAGSGLMHFGNRWLDVIWL